MALFESYERRIDKINSVLSQYGISSVEECREICKAAGFDPYEIVKGIQPICFENAVICLGAVIRGSTSHYDYVCNEVSKGIAAVSLESGVPVLFGVLTTENIEQAIERAGTKAGNKGYDCAVSAIEMVNLLHELDAE